MEGATLYVGNLAWGVNDAQLKALFDKAGTVIRAQVVEDHETKKSRGFGFVEMSNVAEADNAINLLNGETFESRILVVKTARPKRQTNGN